MFVADDGRFVFVGSLGVTKAGRKFENTFPDPIPPALFEVGAGRRWPPIIIGASVARPQEIRRRFASTRRGARWPERRATSEGNT